jgi:hypothetical protein
MSNMISFLLKRDRLTSLLSKRDKTIFNIFYYMLFRVYKGNYQMLTYEKNYSYRLKLFFNDQQPLFLKTSEK